MPYIDVGGLGGQGHRKVLDNTDRDRDYWRMVLGTQLDGRTGAAAPQPAPGRCHVCGTKVVVKGPGEVVIKNAILRVDGVSGRVAAKCCRCKAWVAVPLTYTG